MKADYERQLEAEIDRELKALPEMTAPASLLGRVLRVLEEQARLRWYQRSWATWPLGLQVGSLAILLVLFGALCFGAGRLPHTAEYAVASQKASGWISVGSMLWNIVTVILGALVLVIKRLGTGFLIGCATSLALGYAMCMGLGTLYVRIGFARRAKL